MSKTIEEMIKSGCTYEEATAALQKVWEAATAAREYDIKEAKARQDVITGYKKYLQIICPDISEMHLEEQVAQLESTLITIRDILQKNPKVNDLQLKSKEESNKAESDIEGWVKKLFNKIDAERKDAESADKGNTRLDRLKLDYTLDDFLREMGW